MDRLLFEALRPLRYAARITQRARMIAVPVRLASGALAVIAEQQDSSCAEYAGEIDRLVAAIHAVQDRVRIGVQPVARRTAYPVEAELLASLLGARPALATEALPHCADVMVPPSPVAGIQNISERRAHIARIDDDYLGPRFNVPAVLRRERRAGGDADDGFSSPSPGWPAVSSPDVRGASSCATLRGACWIAIGRTSPSRRRSRAYRSGSVYVMPRFIGPNSPRNVFSATYWLIVY